MHLLSFAKKILMLHVKLSIHILQGILLPTYSILNGIFAICLHFIHIYVHTLERKIYSIHIFTHIYIHLKNNFMLHIHWKSNFCTTHSHFERQFHVIYSNFEKRFRAIFSICAHLQSIWLPIQHTHVHGEQHFHTIYVQRNHHGAA